jgi:hypothetical protein
MVKPLALSISFCASAIPGVLYIDTSAILPQRFHRNIEEGKYRKKENMMFDHYKDMVTVEDKKETNTFKVPDNVQDIVSGVYYLRTLNYDKRKIGEPIRIQGFFDDEVFDFTVTYRGKETVETKAGMIKAIKLIPKMPEEQTLYRRRCNCCLPFRR